MRERGGREGSRTIKSPLHGSIPDCDWVKDKLL